MSREVISMQPCHIKQAYGENRQEQEANEEGNTSAITKNNILQTPKRLTKMLRNGRKRTLKKSMLNVRHGVQSKFQMVKFAKIAIVKLLRPDIIQTTLNLSSFSLYV